MDPKTYTAIRVDVAENRLNATHRQNVLVQRLLENKPLPVAAIYPLKRLSEEYEKLMRIQQLRLQNAREEAART